VDAILRLIDDLIAFVDAKAHGDHIANDQEQAELPDVLKGGIDIFEMGKHNFIFLMVNESYFPDSFCSW
jgi:hypothetical protein